mmetsp:Transcript_34825/g.76136  ORF Transcript_34825/g.76136 Transcript_34825/m.76136 type:complete len:432 (-) Transcript_34825:204-1499(-)
MTDTKQAGGLSERGIKLTTPALSYLGHFLAAKSRPWTESDPDGYIPLVVAENRLSFDILRPKLQESLTLPHEIECYNDFSGIAPLKASIASMMSHTILPDVQVDVSDLFISAGCGAILDNLFFCIAEPGESVLIPAPYYPAFDNDLTAKAALVPVPVPMPKLGELAVAPLEAAYLEAERKGQRATSILLTNPNNPLGTVYKSEQLKEVMAWAFKRGIHVVSDEIYAWSVYKSEPAFVSAPMLLPAAAEAAGVSESAAADLLHTVFGMSKDFCMSGFRVGWVFTKNRTLIQAFNNVGYFVGCSTLLQVGLAGLLGDKSFIDSYLKENCRRLEAGYDALETAIKEAGIPYTPAQGAMFLCIDLRQYLREDSFEGERELFQALFDEERLLFTPGKDCHFETPGNFRMCFAAVPPAALPIAMKRLVSFLKTKWLK